MICLPLRSFSEVGHDGLGSISEITDATGAIIEYYDYDVYGAPTLYNAGGAPIASSIANNPYFFTGREFDFETGLYYYRARYYDPELGRFLEIDPLGYVDSANLYSYVLNNPWNFVDPFGLFIAPPVSPPPGQIDFGIKGGWKRLLIIIKAILDLLNKNLPPDPIPTDEKPEYTGQFANKGDPYGGLNIHEGPFPNVTDINPFVGPFPDPGPLINPEQNPFPELGPLPDPGNGKDPAKNK